MSFPICQRCNTVSYYSSGANHCDCPGAPVFPVEPDARKVFDDSWDTLAEACRELGRATAAVFLPPLTGFVRAVDKALRWVSK